jgi:hypothetical protein
MNARKQFLIDEEVKKIQLQTAQGAEIRTTHSIAKQFLLNGNFFYFGALNEPKAKHIGLGVYVLTAQEKL